MLDAVRAVLANEGYTHIREFHDGTICALGRQIFTTSLLVGLDSNGYQRRYCYEHEEDARKALLEWGGSGDPPGPWIKEKPSDRLGPGVI
jgi:hypothetical protein